MNRTALCAATLAALASAGVARAHHSISMFEISTPIWVKGTVLHYEVINPHAMIALEERQEDGQVRRWRVEGPILARLERMRVGEGLLKAGDVIEVCGFALKESVTTRQSVPDTDGVPARFVHGHLLLMPDGRMQPWGPYGKFDNCVRPDDRTQPWVELLNADAIARDLWCGGRRASAATRADSLSLIAEIDKLLADPCA